MAWCCLANHHIGCGMVCSSRNLVGQDSFLHPDGGGRDLLVWNCPFCEKIDIGTIEGTTLKKCTVATGTRRGDS